jgi:diguanylate cyclase (GGDEF)-like protein
MAVELPARVIARIKSCRTLPTMPGVALRIVDICRSDDVSLAEIADVLKQDPALAARILRYANGAASGARGQVASVHRATILLGALTVQTLALSFSLTSSLQSKMVRGFDHKAYWQRSLFCAAAAQAIAKALGTGASEMLLIASLLQDVGMLALAHALGAEYTTVVDNAGKLHEELVAAERLAFGFDHAAVSAWLANEWKLPQVFIEAAEASHSESTAEVAPCSGRPPSIVAPIALASHIADIFCVANVAVATQRAEAIAARLLGLSSEQLAAVLATTTENVAFGAALLDIDQGQPEKIQQVLDDARESLLALSVRSSLERQALEEISLRDPLTSLWNRAYVDRQLEALFGEATGSASPLAVAFCDIDHFKVINDTYGHTLGDQVIRLVARRLTGGLRDDTDVVGRYGGEEFVVLLPKTPAHHARTVCERLRESVGSGTVATDSGQIVRCTISIGVALSDATVTTARDLLKAADRALYAAKHGGRNRVCVAS